MSDQQSCGRRMTRPAFTMLELIVAIAVVGVLSAIILAAVVRARNNARVVQCQNNCRQVVIASLASEESGLGLPSGIGFYSAIYPFADADDLIDALASFQGDRANGGVPSPSWAVCPDDEWAIRAFGATSYLPSAGIPSPFDVPDGTGVYKFGHERRQLNEIADGLSNTVFIAERLQSPAFLPSVAEARFDPSFVASHSDRYHYWLPPYGSATRDVDEFLSACSTVNLASTDWHPIDRDPFLSRLWHQCSIGFNHVGSPNSTSCYRGDRFAGRTLAPTVTGSTPASSAHPNHVVVALCDGSVRRIADTINLETWRAIGTIRGAELDTSF